MLKIANGQVITDTVSRKSVYIENGKIFAVTEESLPYDELIDAQGRYVAPGFIDMHVHGGGGHDFMDGTVEAVLGAARAHLRHGTTTIYPTTTTAAQETLANTIDMVREAASQEGLPHIHGMHMEGPYVAASQAGAQDPRFIVPPNPEDYKKLTAHANGFIKKWTFAPELPGGEDFCDHMLANGIVPSAGHTDATYEDMQRLYPHGLRGATHFYSGMASIVRRNAYRILGLVEAAYLMDDLDVEVIADGIHLPPPLLRMIYKIKGPDHIGLITDAMRGADMPDGEYILGPIYNGLECITEDGIAKLPDRSCFAGSIATTDRLVRTFYKLVGVDLPNCVKMATQTPARMMGLENVGKLEAGFDADIVLFDDDINVSTVIVKDDSAVRIHNNRGI